MFFLWLLTDWFSLAFRSWLWPLLGFLFMPYTTLVYMVAMLRGGQLTPGWIVLLVIAVLADLSGHGSSTEVMRRRA